MGTRTLRGSQIPLNYFEFPPSNARILIFFYLNVQCGVFGFPKKPSYFFFAKFEIFYIIFFFSCLVEFSDEKILFLFSVYCLGVFMDIYSFMFCLFNSQSDEDAGSDDDGAGIPSVVLAAPTTPAPPVTSAASAAPPAAPLVAEEVQEILSGQYYFIIIVNSNSIQLVLIVCSYCH